MKPDYPLFYSTVALLTPVFLIVLFVGNERLVHPPRKITPEAPTATGQRIASFVSMVEPWLTRFSNLWVVINGLLAEALSLLALYRPSVGFSASYRHLIWISLVFIMVITALELLRTAFSIVPQQDITPLELDTETYP